MTLKVVLERAVVLFLRSLDPGARRRIKAALGSLAANRGPASLWPNVRRLDTPGAGEAVFRLRVGDYRAIFVVRPPEIRVVKVFHRGQGYAWMADLRLD